MSSPRDRDGDEDGRPAGWQEPAHLGGDPAPGSPAPGSPAPGSPVPGDPVPGDPTPRDPAGPGTPGATGSTAADGAGWQPAGWDLPAVEPDRPGLPAAGPAAPVAPTSWPADEPVTKDDPDAGRPRRGLGALGGLFGGRSRDDDVREGPDDDRPADDRSDDEFAQPDRGPAPDPTDPFGTLRWAHQWGWTPSDGTGPQDAELVPLVQSAPVRPGREDRPSRVVRGRGDGLDLVAFDVVSPVGRSWVSTHAVTAAPVLGSVPAFRLSPARLWRHGTAGMLQIPSPDPEFDRRWLLMAAEDGPQLRRLVADPVVRQSLLGTDDGDEIWSAAGFVAAVRPDPNRPQLIEHHARLLAAIAGALAAAG